MIEALTYDSTTLSLPTSINTQIQSASQDGAWYIVPFNEN